jgi:hypothetical protein
MISTEAIRQLEAGYALHDPFPHVVVDNFIKEDALEAIVQSVRSMRSEDAQTKFTNPHSPYEFNKFAFDSGFDATLTELFKELVGDSFTTSIEKLSGIGPLIRNDMSLRGGGVHRIHSGGFLAMHTDFNTYDHPVHGRLDRRLNLLLYLNSDWKEEYNGHLQLHDSTGLREAISPVMNRCVIFNTTNKSIHGHPVPLTVPPDVYRESIAVYYYTKNQHGSVDFEGDSPHCTVWHKTE